MSLEHTFEKIYDAGPSKEVAAALNNDLVGAGIAGEAAPDTVIGSRLFNVATASMISLSKNPDQPLIEDTMKKPDSSDRLVVFTEKLLNSSLQRQGNQGYDFPSESVGTIPAPLSIEDDIMATVGHGDKTPNPKPLLIVNRVGEPVILKNMGVPDFAINFKMLAINQVRYQAGCLLKVLLHPDYRSHDMRPDYDIARVTAIRAIGPQRFSALAFEVADRPVILNPIARYEKTSRSGIAVTYGTLDDVKVKLPKTSAIRRINETLKTN